MPPPLRWRWLNLAAVIVPAVIVGVHLWDVLVGVSGPWHLFINRFFLPFLTVSAVFSMFLAIRHLVDKEQYLQALAGGEQRMVQFLDAMPGGVLVVDARGGLIYANQNAQATLGPELLAECQDVGVLDCGAFFLTGTGQPYPRERFPIRRALAGDAMVVDDVEVRRSGQVLRFELRASPVREPDGSVAYVIADFLDISARYAMQQDLHHQKDVFEKLVGVARLTAATHSLEPTLRNALEVSINITAAERGSLFLVEQDGVVLHSLLSRSQPMRLEYRGSGAVVMEKGLAGWVFRQRQPVVLPDVTQDERWLAMPEDRDVHSALLVPILLDGEALGVLSVFHSQVGHFTSEHLDLTRAASDQMALALRNKQIFEAEQKLAEELANAKEVADAAYRAKSMFLAKVSHELRTPLTIILGYSDMLQEYARTTNLDAIKDPLSKIQGSANQLHNLINDILDFSEIEAGRLALAPSTFDVADLVVQVAEGCHSMAAKNDNCFQVEQGANLGSMTSDPQRIRQVLDNLLENAFKFTHQGTVRLVVRRQSDPAGDWMVFEIHDTGIGMSAEQLMHLFQAFNQVDSSTKRKYGGTGLGLAISRQLARMLGGDIIAVSELNRGSQFTLRLPCNAALG